MYMEIPLFLNIEIRNRLSFEDIDIILFFIEISMYDTSFWFRIWI